jgi:LysM repeat protein
MPHRSHRIPLRAALVVALMAGVAIAVPAAATDRVVVVQRGDTLSEIALRYGMTVAQLRDLNGIADPNRIVAGQRLRLSGQPVVAATAPSAVVEVIHVVASGENLTAIAHRYGSTIAAIAGANGISNPSFLRVGQRLAIPGTAAPAAPAPAATAPAVPAPARAAPPPAPRVHVVASGENLTAIAHRYGSTVAAIAGANGISNPSFLRVGQQLTIPGTKAPAAAPTTMPSGMASLVAARGEIGSMIAAEASAQGVPVPFALAVAWQESGWRPQVVSRAGAVGVMQLTPATADWVGSSMLGERVDPYDASSNVRAGITLLKHYLARYGGDRSLTLAAYYQGQTAADRHGIYRITRPYIASVTALESYFAN